VAEFCRRPLSGPSGMKSPGDRKRRPSRVIDDLSKSSSKATLHRLRVQGPSDPQKPTRPLPRVINTSGNVLTNYLTCRFLSDSTVNSSGSLLLNSRELRLVKMTRDKAAIDKTTVRLREK